MPRVIFQPCIFIFKMIRGLFDKTETTDLQKMPAENDGTWQNGFMLYANMPAL